MFSTSLRCARKFSRTPRRRPRSSRMRRSWRPTADWSRNRDMNPPWSVSSVHCRLKEIEPSFKSDNSIGSKIPTLMFHKGRNHEYPCGAAPDQNLDLLLLPGSGLPAWRDERARSKPLCRWTMGFVDTVAQRVDSHPRLEHRTDRVLGLRRCAANMGPRDDSVRRVAAGRPQSILRWPLYSCRWPSSRRGRACRAGRGFAQRLYLRSVSEHVDTAGAHEHQSLVSDLHLPFK